MRINCSVSVPSRISSHILTWLTLFSDCSDSSYHVLEYSVGQLVLTPRLYLDLSASSFSQSIISIIMSYPGPHSPGANPINQKIPDISSWGLDSIRRSKWYSLLPDMLSSALLDDKHQQLAEVACSGVVWCGEVRAWCNVGPPLVDRSYHT